MRWAKKTTFKTEHTVLFGAAIIFNNIYLTIYFILSDDLKQKKIYRSAGLGREKTCRQFAINNCTGIRLCSDSRIHTISWFSRMVMWFFATFLLFRSEKSLFCRWICSVGCSPHKIQATDNFMVCFLCYSCRGGYYYFVFILCREIKSSSVTLRVYNHAQPYNVPRREWKKHSSSLRMIYFFCCLHSVHMFEKFSTEFSLSERDTKNSNIERHSFPFSL